MAGRAGGPANIVRTTAYDSAEAGGRHDACGGLLCDGSGAVHSAAADWSRYPVGTRFQIVETGETCEIDDYGSALVGTNTIDLFKDSGRDRRSLEILSPRSRNAHVRPMIAALRQQTQGAPVRFHRLQS
jgi:3D (Asp-Asp-Asp) domain-containing protein